MRRARTLDAISQRLGGGGLVWVGTRGSDAVALTELPALFASFTLLDGGPTSLVHSCSLEDVTGVRIDLDAPDAVDDSSEGMLVWQDALDQALASRPSVVCAYRTTEVLSRANLLRPGSTLLGTGYAHQSAFDYKPWVETSLSTAGIATVPWSYSRTGDWSRSEELVRKGPVVVRASRTSGGVGVVPLRDENAFRAWVAASAPSAMSGPDGVMAVAPLLEGALPLNVSAVVFRDGVAVHPASVQLIGIPECTDSPFGYCGNDFAAIRSLPGEQLDEVERQTRVIGDWLRELGYVGAFGVDFLMHQGRILFTELNPRFQGSTRVASLVAQRLDESCVVLDHVAACLGLALPRPVSLREWADAPPVAHVVTHRVAGLPARLCGTTATAAVRNACASARGEVETRRDLATDRGAIVARVVVDDQVTDDGYALRGDLQVALSAWITSTAAEGTAP